MQNINPEPKQETMVTAAYDENPLLFQIQTQHYRQAYIQWATKTYGAKQDMPFAVRVKVGWYLTGNPLYGGSG